MTNLFSPNRTFALSVLMAAVFAVSVWSQAGAGEPEDRPLRKFIAVDVNDISANGLFAVGADVFSREGDVLRALAPQATYETLVRRGIDVTVLHEDIDAAYAQYRANLKVKYGESFKDYHDFDDTVEVLEQVAEEYPDITALEIIGRSLENRPIYLMRISENAGKVDPNKPAILVMGCHHAREWISVEVPLYYVDYLTEQYRKDGDVTRLLRFTEIWIVPVLNPDGFVYSWITDRWWRKNRRQMDTAIDQRNSEVDTELDASDPKYRYEQSVTAQRHGRLIGVEIFATQAGSAKFYAAKGDVRFDGTIRSETAEQWVYIDTSSAGIELSKGSMFTIGVEGTGGELWVGYSENDEYGLGWLEEYVNGELKIRFRDDLAFRTHVKGELVYGVDPNRNYGFEWGHDFGSSGDPASYTYRGPGPFSELETQVIRDLSTGPSGRAFAAGVSYHNYSQVIIYPWGYTTAPVENVLRYRQLGAEMVRLINDAHSDPKHNYRYGQGSVLLYRTSGDYADWAHAETGAIALTVELRPAGYPWFELPPNEIVPTCLENLPSFLYLAHQTMIPNAKLADADKDGFLDDEDYCPNSPSTEVDAVGCDESEQDLDRDGVLNADDACPDTPQKQQVDKYGCRLPTLLTVSIRSNVSAAPISADPADIDGVSRGDTGEDGLTLDYATEGIVIVTARETFNGNVFDHWVVDGQTQRPWQTRVAFTAAADVDAEAVYIYPAELQIVGPTQIPDRDHSGMATVTAYETQIVYDDESAVVVDQNDVEWSVDDPARAAVSGSGELVARSVDHQAKWVTVALSATAAFEGSTYPAQPLEVRIYNPDVFAPACAELSIKGSKQVASNTSGVFEAEVMIEGGVSSWPTQRVGWSVAAVEAASSSELPASISQSGKLITQWVPTETRVMVCAEYSGDEGSACLAELEVTISAGDEADRPAGRNMPGGTTCGALGMLAVMGLVGGLWAMRLGRRRLV